VKFVKCQKVASTHVCKLAGGPDMQTFSPDGDGGV